MRSELARVAFVLLGSSLLTAASLAEENAPDLAKEARLHRLYKKYNETPTPDQVWQEALAKGPAQTYTVGSGDTLWDISNTFFADPGFWPKIWSLNSNAVENPHEILPNQEVHFVEGTFGEPPSLSVKEGVPEEAQVAEAAPAAPVVKGTMPDGEVLVDELPPAKVTSHKNRKIPASLPEWQLVTGFSEVTISAGPAVVAPPMADKLLDFYISESDLGAEGFISENETGLKTSSERQFVYIKFTQPPTNNRYLVVKEAGEINDKLRNKRGKLMQIEGELMLMGLVNPSKNLYRARPLQNLSHFSVGSKVVVGDIPIISLQEEGLAAPLPAQIIGGHLDEDRRLFGLLDVVYLNVGTEGGIAPGQSFTIFKSKVKRDPTSDVITGPLPIGRLKVVKATGQFATAIILESSEEVRTGDSLEGSTPQID